MSMRLAQSSYVVGGHIPIRITSEILAIALKNKLSTETNWFASFCLPEFPSTPIVIISFWLPEHLFRTSLKLVLTCFIIPKTIEVIPANYTLKHQEQERFSHENRVKPNASVLH